MKSLQFTESVLLRASGRVVRDMRELLDVAVEPVDSGYPVTIYLFSAFVHRKRTILAFLPFP